jgi:hypothetical protein
VRHPTTSPSGSVAARGRGGLRGDGLSDAPFIESLSSRIPFVPAQLGEGGPGLLKQLVGALQGDQLVVGEAEGGPLGRQPLELGSHHVGVLPRTARLDSIATTIPGRPPAATPLKAPRPRRGSRVTGALMPANWLGFLSPIRGARACRGRVSSPQVPGRRDREGTRDHSATANVRTAGSTQIGLGENWTDARSSASPAAMSAQRSALY